MQLIENEKIHVVALCNLLPVKKYLTLNRVIDDYGKTPFIIEWKERYVRPVVRVVFSCLYEWKIKQEQSGATIVRYKEWEHAYEEMIEIKDWEDMHRFAVVYDGTLRMFSEDAADLFGLNRNELRAAIMKVAKDELESFLLDAENK